MNAIEMGLSLFLAVLFVGFRAHRICWGLYMLSLKTVARNSNSWVRKSWSQRALSMWNRESKTVCLQDGGVNSGVEKDWRGCLCPQQSGPLLVTPPSIWLRQFWAKPLLV